jgi:hypothetical protein
VDDVSDDGWILWIHSTVEGRRLFELADFYQAWADEECVEFHYKVTRTAPNTLGQPGYGAQPEEHTHAASTAS